MDFKVTKEIVFRELGDADQAALDAMSDAMRERINLRLNILTEALLTPLPPPKLEPIRYDPPRPHWLPLFPLRIAPSSYYDLGV